MTILGTILFTIVVPGSVTILVPYLILTSTGDGVSFNQGLFRFLGLAPLTAGIVMYAWTAWNFATTGGGTPAPIAAPERLVMVGLYRYVRNPMYVSVLLILLGEVLLFESGLLLAYTLLIFMAFQGFIVYYEEPALRREFGDAYEQYCMRVHRWLPATPRS